MKIIDKILRVAIATGLGVIFNKIFSSTNEVKVTDKLKENGVI